MKTVQGLGPEALSGADETAYRWRHVIGAALAAADALAVAVVALAASLLWHTFAYQHFGDTARTTELVLMISGLFVFVNLLQRRYRLNRYLTTRGQMVEAFNAWNVTVIAFIAIGFLAKLMDDYSRGVVIITWIAGAPVIALVRSSLSRRVAQASRAGRIAAQRVLLVGHQDEMMRFLTRYRPWSVGLMVRDMAVINHPESGLPAREKRTLIESDIAEAVARARQLKVDAIYIALPWSESALIEQCVDAFLTVPASINLAPEPILDRFSNPRIIRAGEVARLELTPRALDAAEILLKRAFDLTASLLLLIVAAPAMALVALAIKLDSRGPVFFLQRRYGFNQEPFRIVKFRTMRALDDGDVVRQATANDPRITRVGAWLRRYNLDELPQLFNVVLGQMSLVGPRPHALAHDHEYERKIALYARRHNVKPGITGWAQVHGLRGETDTDAKMADRVAHDLWYIDNWTFWLDIAILFRTVLSPKAYRNAR